MTNGQALDVLQAELTRYQNNNLNQLTDSTPPSQVYVFDDDGNMTQGYTPEGFLFTAEYDAENRLTSLGYTDGANVAHRTEYGYFFTDFLARVRKSENDQLVSETQFVRDGLLAIQDRDGNNNMVSEYLWGLDIGGGIGGLLNMRQGGQDYRYLYDGRGNVGAVIGADQVIAAAYRYDAFGNVIGRSGNLGQPFGFSTKRYDAQTGLSYYGYRYYSSEIGKWLTRDPLGEAGGVNLYGFVQNNPVNFVDPWGLQPGDIYLFTKTSGFAKLIGSIAPGGPYGHSAIEIPGNKVLTADKDGVKIVPLSAELKNAQFDKFRPNNKVNAAALSSFAAAAVSANTQGYNWTGLFGVRDVGSSSVSKEYTCSEITAEASAYSGNPFGDMGVLISPNDISNSPSLKRLKWFQW